MSPEEREASSHEENVAKLSRTRKGGRVYVHWEWVLRENDERRVGQGINDKCVVWIGGWWVTGEGGGAGGNEEFAMPRGEVSIKWDKFRDLDNATMRQ